MSSNLMVSADCPVCEAEGAEEVLSVKAGNIDGSPLYAHVVIDTCNHCGHVFNRLDASDIAGIQTYYRDEYSPVNLSAAELGGDRPGSSHDFSTKRQEALFGLFRNRVSNNDTVLDVGCALGGMLVYLKREGYKNLHGIDISPSYVAHANDVAGISVNVGDAESIPHQADAFDLVILDQVLEHLYDPRRAFLEIARVMKPGGLLAIGVPDASRYGEVYFFDYYWVLMREHIQHFDLDHLSLLARSCGFEYLDHRRTDSAMNSETMNLPNLNALYRFAGIDALAPYFFDPFPAKQSFRRYASDEAARLKGRIESFSSIRDRQKPVYVWGIGREWTYLYANTCASELEIVALIDSNDYKRQNQSLDGLKIMSPSVLSGAQADSILIIAAVAHQLEIEASARQLGFRGEIIKL